jgi:hypothetical protein
MSNSSINRLVIGIIIGIILGFVFGYYISNIRYEDLNAQYQDLNRENLELNTQYEDLETQYEDLNTQYLYLITQYDELNIQYTNITSQHEDLNVQYSSLVDELNYLNSYLEYLREPSLYKVEVFWRDNIFSNSISYYGSIFNAGWDTAYNVVITVRIFNLSDEILKTEEVHLGDIFGRSYQSFDVEIDYSGNAEYVTSSFSHD